MLEEGGALHGAKKSKEDKEREKREKEEEKRRQKEAEKEKKRLEKEKKKNKDNTEDRADRLVWKLSLSYFQQTKICPAPVLKQTQKASF